MRVVRHMHHVSEFKVASLIALTIINRDSQPHCLTCVEPVFVEDNLTTDVVLFDCFHERDDHLILGAIDPWLNR